MGEVLVQAIYFDTIIHSRTATLIERLRYPGSGFNTGTSIAILFTNFC
jgi:hypothetical protein